MVTKWDWRGNRDMRFGPSGITCHGRAFSCSFLMPSVCIWRSILAQGTRRGVMGKSAIRHGAAPCADHRRDQLAPPWRVNAPDSEADEEIFQGGFKNSSAIRKMTLAFGNTKPQAGPGTALGDRAALSALNSREYGYRPHKIWLLRCTISVHMRLAQSIPRCHRRHAAHWKHQCTNIVRSNLT
jgi:hypothetical protein